MRYYDVVVIKGYEENAEIENYYFSVFGREWSESEETAIEHIEYVYRKHGWGSFEVFYVAPTKICQCCNQVIEIEEEDYNTPENWEKFRKGRK